MTPTQFKRLREQLGMTTDEVADLLELGVNGDRTVRRWEAGEKDIPGPVVLVMELCSEVPEVREYLDLQWIDGGKEKKHGGHYDD
jgi:DNA-binding transcriptional regulator YiaG